RLLAARAGSVGGSAALADGPLVAWGRMAGVVRVADDESVSRTSASLADEPSVDPLRPVARLAGASAPRVGAAALDRAALGTAAQLVGLGQAMLDLTVTYVKDRHQF